MSAWLSSLWETDGCFVALLPANRTAAVAFSDVHARVKAPKEEMMVSKGSMTLAEALAFYASLGSDNTSGRPSIRQVVDGSSFSSTGTVDDADLASTTIGAFVFSLDKMPARRKLGWYAGLPLSAKFRYDAEKAEADMVLTLNPSHGVSCDHLLFSFLPDSSSFAIRKLRKGSQVAFSGQEITSKEWAAVVTPHATLAVGDLSYHIVWTVPEQHEKVFRSRRDKYTTSELNFELPIQSVSSTESVFFSAIGPQGELVVIKQMIRKDSPSAKDADREIQQYEDIRNRLQHHPNRQFIIQLHDLICSSGRRSFEEVQSADIVNLVISPLARGTFWDILITGKDAVHPYTKTKLFAQSLLGVSALHEVGYVHRDLKPTNIGVVSLSPPRAVVLDIIQAKYIPTDWSKGVECTPGYSGTVGFHAPETERE
ncbi:hypothetical protein B0A55_10765 [Friedmanniomyces simplex]|uniref:Protein kinase domain-containing protein n=1 Tax=Friedmanniomyces simplex TaxID=329884 RepID=A0A4V5NFH1_9PEZI|nr:hypothetical protein B0A55_10765 [Friedmanniomyces simplex]